MNLILPLVLAASFVKPGDNVVMIGDSITQFGASLDTGYYHFVTNAVATTADCPKFNLIPLGFGGYQVGSWSRMERNSTTNDVFTWYAPKYNLRTVLDGKVDVIAIFLGMNDILQPSIHETDADIAQWVADYRQFIANLRSRCHPRAFALCTITPLTADSLSPKNRMRERLNNEIRRLAVAEKAEVIEFGDAVGFRQRLLHDFDDGYHLVPDFVHPDPLGHAILARTLMTNLGCPCRGLADIERKMSLKVRKGRADDLVLNLKMMRSALAGDSALVYNLRYAFGINTPREGVRPTVRVKLPFGWTANEPYRHDFQGAFVLRGMPEHLLTPVTVEATMADGSVLAATCQIPAPWRLSEDGGDWVVYTPNDDYTGGAKPGSIDPYQCFYGYKSNELKAVRRVWSDKDRLVTAVLSHQGFSETLDLTVSLDGKTVWQDKLDRNGRNRVAKTVSLHAGWNALEVRCVHHDWQRQFAFDLEPLVGDDLSQLKYDLQ